MWSLLPIPYSEARYSINQYEQCELATCFVLPDAFTCGWYGCIRRICTLVQYHSALPLGTTWYPQSVYQFSEGTVPGTTVIDDTSTSVDFFFACLPQNFQELMI